MGNLIAVEARPNVLVVVANDEGEPAMFSLQISIAYGLAAAHDVPAIGAPAEELQVKSVGTKLEPPATSWSVPSGL
jgi:hypothetical protein